MFTIVESPLFTSQSRAIWSEDERGAFCAWLAANPDAGDVIPATGGCRKVRWAVDGRGKRGGARVVYFNRTDCGKIFLLTVYTKAVIGNIPAHLLRAIKQEIEHVYYP